VGRLSPIIASISSLSAFILRGLRCLFNDIVCILSVYHYSAAWNEVIEESIYYIASKIAVFAELSISTIALSLRTPERALKGVSHNCRSRIWFGSPWSFKALLIASNRSGILTDLLVFSLLKRIRLFTASRPFLGSRSLFWVFLRWISVQLSSLSDCLVIRLLIFAILV
jgi:hypothetical protein